MIEVREGGGRRGRGDSRRRGAAPYEYGLFCKANNIKATVHPF